MLRNKNMDEDNSILGWIYQIYQESHPREPQSIRASFENLYEAMNGMPLADIDKIIYPVCALCAEHERIAFEDGIQVGVQLALDLEL